MVCYSPLSWYVAEFTPYEDLKPGRKGRLGVYLFLSIRAQDEHEGEIPLQRMRRELRANPELYDDDEWADHLNYLNDLSRSVWPENRACLLYVAERLRAALPVEAVKINPELRAPDPGV